MDNGQRVASRLVIRRPLPTRGRSCRDRGCEAIADSRKLRYNSPLSRHSPPARTLGQPQGAGRLAWQDAGVHRAGRQGQSRREERGARVDTAEDFAQLQLHFVDRLQWRYEVIRPLLLFADRTLKQRAEETQTHIETVRDLLRRFHRQGLRGLVPDDVAIVPKGKTTRVPQAVVDDWRV